MISCDEEEPILPISGPFNLWAINRPICPGMEVQLYLYEQATGSVVDFSEFTFEVVPNGLGEISSTGLFKAPELISGQSNVVITAKWKSNPNVQASHTLYLTSNSDSHLITKVPHKVQFGNVFYGLSLSNEFLFGSPFIGTGPNKTLGLEVRVVNTEGQIKWWHNLGIGQTTFGTFYQDKTLLSGWIVGMDGSPTAFSKIYDAAGTDLNTEVQNQMVFRDYFVDLSENLFLSNSSKRYPTNPTQIVKLSQELDILHNYSINHPVYSFLVNQDDAVIAFYSDEIKEESGIVMVDNFGEEVWNLPLPYWYPNVGKLVQINQEKYGLVRSECRFIPCALELIYYEFGINGHFINPGQTIANSNTLDMLINGPFIDQQYYYIRDDIKDVLVFEEETLVVFGAITRNLQALIIKGNKGTSLEYWWDPKIAGQTPMGHIHLKLKDIGIEWKTFCGQAICTFQLDKSLAFDSCF